MRKVQPSKGRYFAIAPAEAWSEARHSGLVSEEQNRAPRLLFVNPGRASAANIPLIQLEGPWEIQIFSLPERLDPDRGRQGMLRALELAAVHRGSVIGWTRLQQVSLLVLLTEEGRLMVVARTSWYQERKYRGSAKFSTAFKMRKVKTQDRQVGSYAL